MHKTIIWEVKVRFRKKDGQFFATHTISIPTFSSSSGILDTKSIGPLMTTPLFSIDSFWLPYIKIKEMLSSSSTVVCILVGKKLILVHICTDCFFPSSDNLPTSTTQQVLWLHLKESGRNRKIKLAQCISMIMYNNTVLLMYPVS